jgi:hypothetical protein
MFSVTCGQWPSACGEAGATRSSRGSRPCARRPAEQQDSCVSRVSLERVCLDKLIAQVEKKGPTELTCALWFEDALNAVAVRLLHVWGGATG